MTLLPNLCADFFNPKFDLVMFFFNRKSHTGLTPPENKKKKPPTKQTTEWECLLQMLPE